MTIVKFAFLGLFAALANVPAISQACGGLGYTYKDVYVRADGSIDRTVKKAGSDTSEILLNDHYHLQFIGDAVTLVAGTQLEPEMNSSVSVELLEQVSDTYVREGQIVKGVFATLYKVTKTEQAKHAGGAEPKVTVEYVRVDNNYAGNGTYTRGCGDIQVENDRTKIVMPVRP